MSVKNPTGPCGLRKTDKAFAESSGATCSAKIPPSLRMAEHWERTCDTCDSQEDSHYCLLHSVMVKNMDIMRCDDHVYSSL